MGLHPQLFVKQHTMLHLHLLLLLVSVWAGGEKTYLVKTGEPKSCDVLKLSDCIPENGCIWLTGHGYCQAHSGLYPVTDGPVQENAMESESDIKSQGSCYGKKEGGVCEKIGTAGPWCRAAWPICGKETGRCRHQECRIGDCSGKKEGEICEVEGVSGPVCRGFWPHCGKKTGLCLNNVCKVFRTEPCAGKKKGDVCEVEGTAGPWCRSIWPACGKRSGRCSGRWGDVCKFEAPGSGSDCSKRKEGAVCDPLCKAAFCKPNTGRCRKKRCVFVGSSRPVARG